MTAAAASTHARTVVDSTLPTQMQICEVKDFTIRVHVILFELSLGSGSGRRHWPICWCCLDRGPGTFDMEDATTLSWSSAAVSE